MTLADGTDLLLQKRAKQPVRAAVRQYRAAVTLPADLALPWRYRMNGRPDQTEQYLSCSSNGAGDAVNCFCAEGFIFSTHVR